MAKILNQLSPLPLINRFIYQETPAAPESPDTPTSAPAVSEALSKPDYASKSPKELEALIDEGISPVDDSENFYQVVKYLGGKTGDILYANKRAAKRINNIIAAMNPIEANQAGLENLRNVEKLYRDAAGNGNLTLNPKTELPLFEQFIASAQQDPENGASYLREALGISRNTIVIERLEKVLDEMLGVTAEQ